MEMQFSYYDYKTNAVSLRIALPSLESRIMAARAQRKETYA
jgi:hypothetical protein